MMYAGLLTLLRWAYRARTLGQLASFSVSYSALMEIVQYFLPYRSFDLLDLLANALGVMFAWIILAIVYFVSSARVK